MPTSTQDKGMLVSELTVTRIEHEVSKTEKKVIYDFGDDIDEYRYLVEDWKWNGYGWVRVNMSWPDVNILADLVL